MTVIRSQLKLSSQLGYPIWPLRVTGGGRAVTRADGAPFYIHGDTGSSAAVMHNRTDVVTYFADRAARGYTTVWVSLIEHLFSDNVPPSNNVFGNAPFSGTISGELDFTTPVEAYWQHVDYIISTAMSYGITIFAFPAYLGFTMGTEGWASAIIANTATRMTTYGTFLGNRYKNYPNIIWVLGGDSPPNTPTDLTVHVNNLALAIKAASPAHLMSAHSTRLSSSFDSYNQSWLDINLAYPDNVTTHKYTRLARQQTVKPVLMGEAYFGNEHTMTSLNLRTQMYQGLLGGGLGHAYGQSPMWYFGLTAGSSGNAFADTGGLNWHNTLGSFMSDAVIFVRRLTNARPDITYLTPDYSHVVVTVGYDSGGIEGVTYCPVMANNRQLVVYNPQGSTAPLTVDKSKFVTATFNFNWYNPRTGATTAGGTSAFGSGTQVFTAPDTNDWVLLAEDQALGLGNP